MLRSIVQEAFEGVLMEDAYDDLEAKLSVGFNVSLYSNLPNRVSDWVPVLTPITGKIPRSRTPHEALSALVFILRKLMRSNIGIRDGDGKKLPLDVGYFMKNPVTILVRHIENTVQFIHERQEAKRREGDYDVVYKSGSVVAFKVRSTEASCKLGSNTNWCISARSSGNMFDTYNRNANIFMVHTKKEKYAILVDRHDGSIVEVQVSANTYRGNSDNHLQKFFNLIMSDIGDDEARKMFKAIGVDGEKYRDRLFVYDKIIDTPNLIVYGSHEYDNLLNLSPKVSKYNVGFQSYYHLLMIRGHSDVLIGSPMNVGGYDSAIEFYRELHGIVGDKLLQAVLKQVGANVSQIMKQVTWGKITKVSIGLKKSYNPSDRKMVIETDDPDNPSVSTTISVILDRFGRLSIYDSSKRLEGSIGDVIKQINASVHHSLKVGLVGVPVEDVLKILPLVSREIDRWMRVFIKGKNVSISPPKQAKWFQIVKDDMQYKILIHNKIDTKLTLRLDSLGNYYVIYRGEARRHAAVSSVVDHIDEHIMRHFDYKMSNDSATELQRDIRSAVS